MNEENKDALNNLINSIQEKMGNNVENSDGISSLLNTLNTNNSSSSKEDFKSNETNPFSSIDPTIILKIQKIMSAMKSNTPQKDLLISLKPFLRKSRQDKMGDYLTILSIISILESLKEKGSD
jgi:hypothetical protein